MLAWFASSLLLVCALSSFNINRINIIFLPLIFFLAMGASVFVSHFRAKRVVYALVFVAYLANFSFFMHSYLNPPPSIRKQFFSSFLEALNVAKHQAYKGNICVTDHVNMPYIYVLFATKLDTNAFVSSVKYVEPNGAFRSVLSMAGYIFGLESCPINTTSTFVASNDELGIFDNRFNIKRLENYSVVTRK